MTSPSGSVQRIVNEAPPRSPRLLEELSGALPRFLENLRSSSALLKAIVWRDLKAKYQSSGLGYLWSLLNPLVMLLIYGWVFSTILRVPVDDFALFLACGLLPWLWTSESLSVGTGSIVNNAGMVRRVHFPVEVLPVSVVASQFIHFLLGLPILFGFLFFFGRGPQVYALALPLLMGAQFCLNVGLVLITATLNVHFRDLQYIVSNALLFLIFSAPIIYPLEQVPPEFRPWLGLNPFTPLVTSYQDVLFFGRWPDWIGALVPLWIVAIMVLWVGAVVAHRHRWSLVEEL